MNKLGGDRDVILKIYPGVHHVFDVARVNSRYRGKLQLYDAEAAEDAFTRIRVFLAKHLR